MSIPLYIFAKAPIPGNVKTRLQPHCNAVQSARIAEILLDHCLKQANSFWPGPVVISTSNKSHPSIQSLAAKYHVAIVEQGDGDLGKRMLRCFEINGYPLAILGSDVPGISKSSFESAYDALNNGHQTLGPAKDGGYYLIGLTKPCANLFNQINWGTSAVLSTTLNRAKETGINFHQLEANNDVDTWEDLLEAARNFPEIQEYLLSQGLL